jgi:NADP-dependent 3-hydroxy acid dehydrogenase YdfG
VTEPTAKRTAVVTGASSGLGVAIAEALAALGWCVAIGARRTDRLIETAERITQAGGVPFHHPLDVADAGSVDTFFDAATAAVGPIDVVVNNAGLSFPGNSWELSPKDLAYEVAVNLLGPMYVTRRALPDLIARGEGGDLVFISSDAARNIRPRQATYSATKAGLEAYVRAVGMELEGTGVRTCVVRPGPAASEYAASWGSDQIVDLMSYWPRFGLQRHTNFMPADAVARAVVLAVTTPRGVVLDTIEVQPEAPIDGDA